jgi:hypothetical protein
MADFTVKNLGRFDQAAANICKITLGRKYDAALALCNRYAGLAEKTLRDSQGVGQGEGQFWTNQTSDAVKSAFGYTIADSESVGWGLAHGMEYGVWLELANNREHAAIEPAVRVLSAFFFDDLRKIYAG